MAGRVSPGALEDIPDRVCIGVTLLLPLQFQGGEALNSASLQKIFDYSENVS